MVEDVLRRREEARNYVTALLRQGCLIRYEGMQGVLYNAVCKTPKGREFTGLGLTIVDAVHDLKREISGWA